MSPAAAQRREGRTSSRPLSEQRGTFVGSIQRMENVGIVVDDLAAATAFFIELGLELLGEGMAEGEWVDRVVGLENVRAVECRYALCSAGQVGSRDTDDRAGRTRP
jgi:hypothetical protein